MSFYPSKFQSWGNTPGCDGLRQSVFWKDENLPKADGQTMLPYGLGRSYGDSCLNPGGIHLLTRHLRRFMEFNEKEGLLRCEAGVTLDELLLLIVPQGWFLPVTPGTKYVTLGGAIANDIHGKNHHRAGTFGCHVTAFELLRSDNSRVVCSPDANIELFKATIGGLGLTGLITWAEIKLKPIETAFLALETIKFDSLDELFKISETSNETHEYTVAWLDTRNPGVNSARGLFFRANHLTRAGAPAQKYRTLKTHSSRWQMSVPRIFPGFLLSKWAVKIFNAFYFRRQTKPSVTSFVHYDSFFYQLDKIHHWNRLYGRRGLKQYQVVFPRENCRRATRDMLDKLTESGLGAFLCVAKEFGEESSPGILSFPKSGLTLALDFPDRGEKTKALFSELDSITRAYDGIVNPAKDACMEGVDFRTGYPDWEAFSKLMDPDFSSGFWRRVMTHDQLEEAVESVETDYAVEDALMERAADNLDDEDDIGPIPV